MPKPKAKADAGDERREKNQRPMQEMRGEKKTTQIKNMTKDQSLIQMPKPKAKAKVKGKSLSQRPMPKPKTKA
jgi:hypothetical protein